MAGIGAARCEVAMKAKYIVRALCKRDLYLTGFDWETGDPKLGIQPIYYSTLTVAQHAAQNATDRSSNDFVVVAT